jgi:hypothetical protein
MAEFFSFFSKVGDWEIRYFVALGVVTIRQFRSDILGKQMGCSTWLCLTIWIDEKLFDKHQKLGCSTRI